MQRAWVYCAMVDNYWRTRTSGIRWAARLWRKPLLTQSTATVAASGIGFEQLSNFVQSPHFGSEE